MSAAVAPANMAAMPPPASSAAGVASSANHNHPTAASQPNNGGGAGVGVGVGVGANEVDERLLAKSTLDNCNARISQLTTEYAGAFVAVERRGVALRSSLSALLERVDDCSPLVDVARSQLTAEEGGRDEEGGATTNDGGVNAGGSNAASTLAGYSERHRLRRRTMLQHSALLELLELPNLMDACVRSNLYDEALSVAAFANTLERRHRLHEESSGGPRDEDAPGEGEGGEDGGGGGGGGGVVSGVIAEVRAREVDLRRHLIGQLRGDVTMPQCLEIVTALRRLNGIELERRQTAEGKGGGGDAAAAADAGGGSGEDLERVHAEMEVRLQVDFFEARDRWLERGDVAASGNAGPAGAGAPPGGASGGPSEQLLDCIERHRTRCFEIATQFLAIFRTAGGGGGGGAIPTSPSTSPGRGGAETRGGGGSGGDAHPSSCPTSLSLLSMWCTRRINLFLSTLKYHLDASAPPPPGSGSGSGPGGSGASSSSHAQRPIISAASLRDALDATVFFAASMGRIGADFQPLLPRIFHPRLVALVVHHWDDGARTLDDTLRVCRDAGVAGPLYSASVTIGADGGAGDDAEGAGGGATDGAGAGGEGGKVEAPPRKLLAYPPLARYVNSFLIGLNELRRCLLPGTFPQLRSNLARVLMESKASLSGNERKVNTPGFLRGESVKLRKVAAEYVDVFDSTVEPYLRRALDVALGCPSEEKEEKENSGVGVAGETKSLEEVGGKEDACADASSSNPPVGGDYNNDDSVAESGDSSAVESGAHQAEGGTDSNQHNALAEETQIGVDEGEEPARVDANVVEGDFS